MNKGAQITIVAASCNEASQAQEWLEHVSWAQRVVVVDTGSTDGTPEILRAGGADVQSLRHRRGGIVHVAKNQGIDSIREGWILDLDLDERVPARLREEIARTVGSCRETPAAYRVPFRHYVFGRWLRHGGWRGSHVRLYRSACARYAEDRAHSSLEVTGRVDDLASPIVHFAHPTLHDFLVKMNRYTSEDAPLICLHGRGGLRHRPPLPARPRSWLWASASVFWNRYLKSAGFLDGMPGFLIASLLATYNFVEQAKVWELAQQAPTAKPR